MHTRVLFLFFISLSLFLFLSALFFRFFPEIVVPCALLKLFHPFSLSPILFCVTRTLHRRSSVLERSTLYTAMLSRKSNPFSARPTNGRFRSRCIRQCLRRLFSLFVIRPVQNFIRFPLRVLSRTISSGTTSGTLAQMFSRTRGSASLRFVRLPLSWLPSRCSYPPPRLAIIFPLISRRSFNSDRICRSAARSRALLSYTISRSQFLRDPDIHEVSI